jgi:hypothetical protein
MSLKPVVILLFEQYHLFAFSLLKEMAGLAVGKR